MVARLGAAFSAGHYSIAAVVDSGRTVLAGLLLIFPGILSDILALTLLLLPRAMPEAVPARSHGNVIDGQFRRER